MRFATFASAMKAMSCIRPLHSGQARASMAKTFWSRSAQGMRWVLAGRSVDFTRRGFSVVSARVTVSGDGGTGSGAVGTTRWRALEFGANTP